MFDHRRTITIVVPCFNEAANLPPLVAGVGAALAPLDVTWRWLFVDDGSSDGTVEVLNRLRGADERIRWISLARNFGLQAALAAGLSYADGDAIIVMDADGQDDPAAIPEFIKRWRDGADLVYAVRTTRDEPFFRRSAIRAFHWVLSKLSDTPIPRDAGTYALYDRRAVDWINRLPERGRYLPGLRAWVGLRQEPVPVARLERRDGAPRQSFARLVGLALDGVFSFSKQPLRLASAIGLIVMLMAATGLFIVFWWRFVSRSFPPNVGLATIALAVLFLSGVQLFVLGIFGEYLGRVFDEAKGRPLFLVASATGVDVGDR